MRLTRIIKSFQYFLLIVILFLAPNQLAYHFWPSWSYVYGIRIDYLSPSIYLSEILILILLFLQIIYFAINKKTKFHPAALFKEYRNTIPVVLLFIVNFCISDSRQVSGIFISRIVLLILFALFIKDFPIKNKLNLIVNTLATSTIAFAAIGLSQFIMSHSIQGILYYLGERAFDTRTIGISLHSYFGRELLRPYSTFSHPNSMAGYFLLLSILVTWRRRYLNKLLLPGYCVFLTIILFVSQSKAVFMAAVSILCFSIINKYYKFKYIKFLPLIFFALGITELLIAANSGGLLANILYIDDRIKLLRVTEIIIKDNVIFGTGFNTFIINISKGYLAQMTSWILQPVHNVYALVFAESGMLGLLIIYIYAQLIYAKTLLKNNYYTVSIWLAILVTGLFDHYWITIFQNNLMLAIVFGLIFNKNMLYDRKNL